MIFTCVIPQQDIHLWPQSHADQPGPSSPLHMGNVMCENSLLPTTLTCESLELSGASLNLDHGSEKKKTALYNVIRKSTQCLSLDQCPMPINAVQNHGIDPKCLSMLINADQFWSIALNDRYWSQLIGIDQHWLALGNDPLYNCHT